jgi:hypothetical protein
MKRVLPLRAIIMPIVRKHAHAILAPFSLPKRPWTTMPSMIELFARSERHAAIISRLSRFLANRSTWPEIIEITRVT